MQLFATGNLAARTAGIVNTPNAASAMAFCLLKQVKASKL